MHELGLVNDCRSNDDVKLFCGMLDGLSFLPVDKVSEGMALLCQQQPDCEGLSALVDYFDATYVSGSARTIQRPADAAGDQPSVSSLRLRRIPPIFPSDKWNVHDTTVSGGDRTNNFS